MAVAVSRSAIREPKGRGTVCSSAFFVVRPAGRTHQAIRAARDYVADGRRWVVDIDLDKELERRGHAFCRYADDCNIYVYSRCGGERLAASLERYLDVKLRLTVNQTKSAVDRPWNRTFPGYSRTSHKRPRLRVGKEAVRRLKGKVKLETRRHAGQQLRAQGVDADTARRPSFNGRGAWWNARAKHTHLAFPKRYFDRLGLFSLVDALVPVS